MTSENSAGPAGQHAQQHVDSLTSSRPWRTGIPCRADVGSNRLPPWRIPGPAKSIPGRSRSGRGRSPAGGRQHAARAQADRRHGTGDCDHASTATSAGSSWCSAAGRWETVSTPGRPPDARAARHSTIVRCRGVTSHSTRIWSRTCAGTRCSHQRRTRATSSSGNPASATRQVSQQAMSPWSCLG